MTQGEEQEKQKKDRSKKLIIKKKMAFAAYTDEVEMIIRTGAMHPFRQTSLFAE